MTHDASSDDAERTSRDAHNVNWACAKKLFLWQIQRSIFTTVRPFFCRREIKRRRPCCVNRRHDAVVFPTNSLGSKPPSFTCKNVNHFCQHAFGCAVAVDTNEKLFKLRVRIKNADPAGPWSKTHTHTHTHTLCVPQFCALGHTPEKYMLHNMPTPPVSWVHP